MLYIGLNSGAFIGYYQDIINMLQSTNIVPSDLLQHWPTHDQGIYIHLYLSRTRNISVDYSMALFQSFGGYQLPNIPINGKKLMDNVSSTIVGMDPQRNNNTKLNFFNIDDIFHLESPLVNSPNHDTIPTVLMSSLDNHLVPILHFNGDHGKRILHQLLKKHSVPLINMQRQTCNDFHHVIFV